MKIVNQTIAAVVAVYALVFSSAFAEVKPAVDPLENFVFSIEAVEFNIPEEIDNEVLLRICANDPNNYACPSKEIQ